uniref:C-type lectin domain-containing protein n=1 Tax=Salmo trutta TaxID=8032 RepID=A0A674EEF9_SALTR
EHRVCQVKSETVVDNGDENDFTPKSRQWAKNPGTESSERRLLQCLVLLCVVLLAGIIGLCVYYNEVKGSFEENILVSKTNSSAERDQFQTRYNAMTEKRDQSSLYFISTKKKTWEESRHDCLRRGAKLVIINSREEQVFIHGLKKETFWIGLTERVEEALWKLVDGTDFALQWFEDSTPKEVWHNASCKQLHLCIFEKMAYVYL